MFSLSYTKSFVAAMKLPENTGPCGRLHGHTYVVTALIQRTNLDKSGMVIDYHELDKVLDKVLSKLDHNFLNDLEHFKNTPPTSENIAKYIFDKISFELENHDSEVTSITIAEDRNVTVRYSKD
jgi:6-pyruvoyltetrahydropterin/6-carboxytetrahydropterin synthase